MFARRKGNLFHCMHAVHPIMLHAGVLGENFMKEHTASDENHEIRNVVVEETSKREELLPIQCLLRDDPPSASIGSTTKN
jgi:hypothetical protein